MLYFGIQMDHNRQVHIVPRNQMEEVEQSKVSWASYYDTWDQYYKPNLAIIQLQ